MNQQLPIEPQLVSKLADNLNTEIVLGAQESRYVHTSKPPGLHGAGADHDGPVQKRADIIHSAAALLEE
ncbi:hypothetical protein J3R83DRAFT_13651 [Lanmaoa asiatica]|nr:hypothetical protein J3R83DRAFT_13651 [Lanmaoa asiatica]